MTPLLVFSLLAAADDAKLGVSAALDLSFAAPSVQFDDEGKSEDLEGEDFSVEPRFLLVNLGVAYDFAGLGIRGLAAGLDLPIVSNSLESTLFNVTTEQKSTGLGDLSVHAGYVYPAVPDMLDVGVRARFKMNTGKSALFDDLDDDEMFTGSGFNNLQLSALASGAMSGVDGAVELGWLAQLSRTDDGMTVDPGDIFFINGSVGYLIADMIEPRILVMFASSGDNEAGPEGGDLTSDADGDGEADEPASNWIGVALDVAVRIDDMLSVHATWGTRLDPLGLNLPYGYVLAGEETLSGLAAFTLGVSASL
jgi:hypothetical protein